MVDPITGIDSNLAGISDIVNRQNVGASQKARNELIRQQTQSGKSPDLSSLYSTQQPGQSPSLSNIPDTWSSIDKNLPSFRGTLFKGGYSGDDRYNQAVEDAKNYASYGFVPGNSPTGWTMLTPEWTGRAKAPKDFIRWSKGDLGLDYDPIHGYKAWRDVGSEGDMEGISLVGSVIGGVIAPGLGVAAFGSNPGSLYNFGSSFANNAANSALKSFVSSGGDVNATFKGAALGGLTSGLNEWLSKNPVDFLGNAGTKVLGGAASGGLNSLFTGNNPIQGSLFGGISGGLHGYLNSVNPNADPFNKTLSNVVTSVAKKKLMRKR